MKIHPLKLISLISIFTLIFCQLGLIAQMESMLGLLFGAVLIIPLLIPLKGLLQDQRYTFKWVGFLTLFYFSIGISEGFVSPENRLYSILTVSFSCLLFLSSVYYSRFLRITHQSQPQEDRSHE